ncbi:hypothetical protein ACLB2K_022876 [Fragaria x ananassa]
MFIAVDSISPSQSIRDDGSTLVSSDGSFELGFFSPGQILKGKYQHGRIQKIHVQENSLMGLKWNLMHTLTYFRKDGVKYYRSGPWNGLRFSGAPALRPNPIYSFNFVYNDDEVYYMYKLQNKSVISIMVLNGTTSTRDRVTWIEAEKTWKAYASVPRDFCDRYGLCGPNANCIISNNPVCQCLQGFEPKSPQKWNLTDWSLGCVRNKPLSCQESDKMSLSSSLT